MILIGAGNRPFPLSEGDMAQAKKKPVQPKKAKPVAKTVTVKNTETGRVFEVNVEDWHRYYESQKHLKLVK